MKTATFKWSLGTLWFENWLNDNRGRKEDREKAYNLFIKRKVNIAVCSYTEWMFCACWGFPVECWGHKLFRGGSVGHLLTGLPARAPANPLLLAVLKAPALNGWWGVLAWGCGGVEQRLCTSRMAHHPPAEVWWGGWKLPTPPGSLSLSQLSVTGCFCLSSSTGAAQQSLAAGRTVLAPSSATSHPLCYMQQHGAGSSGTATGVLCGSQAAGQARGDAKATNPALPL